MQLLWDGLTEALQLIIHFDQQVVDAALRSLWISVIAVCIAAVLGVSIGSLLARCRFFGRSAVVLLFRAGMGVPTVLIGLLCFALLSRRGPLGGLELLYTPWGIILGEFGLACHLDAWSDRESGSARRGNRFHAGRWTVTAVVNLPVRNQASHHFGTLDCVRALLY